MNDQMDITYDIYKDKGYRFFFPILERCLALEGDGDTENLNTTFLAVIQLPASDVSNDKHAIVLTTKYAFDNKSMEIQNVETLLMNKHGFTSIAKAYTHYKEIHAILSDAKSELKNSSRVKSDDAHNSAALRDLETIVRDAVVSNASDIHIYTYADKAEAIFRIDGKFLQSTPLGREQALSLVSAALNTKSDDYRSIADENEMVDVSVHLPITLPDPNDSEKDVVEKINLRTSKSGAIGGPHTVMRVIRTSQDAVKSISDLGMDADIKKLLMDATETPSGIILLTGPTGSGKSTTLTALYESIDEARKIILLEDPVEYRVRRKNCSQKPVYPDQPHLGFIDYLKNALRQDPDIIGISEMRDKDVISVVIKAALTGHLMISTLHTNDALGAVSRLVDEGVSPQTLADTNLLRAVAAQRLIPKLCPHCRIKADVPTFKSAYVKSKNGCKQCGWVGTKGRVLIAEIIMFDEKCREFIADFNMKGLEKYIKGKGWKGMADRTRMRVEQGLIDPYEAKSSISNLFDTGDGANEIQYPPTELALLDGALEVSSQTDKSAAA